MARKKQDIERNEDGTFQSDLEAAEQEAEEAATPDPAYQSNATPEETTEEEAEEATKPKRYHPMTDSPPTTATEDGPQRIRRRRRRRLERNKNRAVVNRPMDREAIEGTKDSDDSE